MKTRMEKDYLLKKGKLNGKMTSEVIAFLYNTIGNLKEEVFELKKYKAIQEKNNKIAREKLERISEMRKLSASIEKSEIDEAFQLITGTKKTEENLKSSKEDFPKEVDETFEKLFGKQDISSK